MSSISSNISDISSNFDFIQRCAGTVTYELLCKIIQNSNIPDLCKDIEILESELDKDINSMTSDISNLTSDIANLEQKIEFLESSQNF
jgi:hypothetical protein